MKESSKITTTATGNGSKNIYAYIWFDVEDYITPESNEIPLQAINILKKYHVPVTMKLVGEKVRFMKQHKRQDVISAIRGYCDVGYHSDTHSRHPVTYEYIAKMDTLRGAKEIEKRERRGLEELRNTFGKNAPVCFGHAGSQWTPHYYPYLKRAGIDVYMDATDIVNIDDLPYWYCGVLNLNNTYKNYIRFDRTFEKPSGSEELKKRFQSIHADLKRKGGGAISILWHPHTAVNQVYWDSLNFSNGRNTPRGKYIVPKKYPAEIQKRALEDFEKLIRLGKSFGDVQFISATDAGKIYRRKLEMVFSEDEVKYIADALSSTSKISFLKLRDGEMISPAQAFCALTNFVASYSKTGRVPRRTAVSEPLGPMSPFKSKVRSKRVPLTSVLRASENASRFIAAKGFMPSSVKVDALAELAPSDFLATLSKLIGTLLSGATSRETIYLRQAKMILSEKYVDGPAFKRACKWSILSTGFHAPKILEQARLQAWTLVPAVPRVVE
jgi:hypothetical protein